MRPTRPGTAISLRRLAYRRRYADYMRNREWQQRRRAWLRTFRRRHGHDPTCAVCDRPWTLDHDLHHVSYDNLGAERDEDLLPACRGCHEALHQILDSSRAWRAMPRPAATAGIISTLRAGRHSVS
jgi:hypothetical protein